jgi:hypothetical protein
MPAKFVFDSSYTYRSDGKACACKAHYNQLPCDYPVPEIQGDVFEDDDGDELDGLTPALPDDCMVSDCPNKGDWYILLKKDQPRT